MRPRPLLVLTLLVLGACDARQTTSPAPTPVASTPTPAAAAASTMSEP